MANFNSDAWVRAARDRFGSAGEYPLIDDAEIIGEMSFDFWPWEYGPPGRGSAEELFRQALTSDHYDIPVRFVYLNLFFRLAHYPAEKFASVVEDQQSAAGHRAQFLEYFETLVGLVDPNDCQLPRPQRRQMGNCERLLYPALGPRATTL